MQFSISKFAIWHHNRHNWRGRSYLWRNNIPRDHHDLLNLCSCLRNLGNMHIHLISIKIGIVWGCDRQIQSERRVGQDSDLVTLQRRLSVHMSEFKITYLPKVKFCRITTVHNGPSWLCNMGHYKRLDLLSKREIHVHIPGESVKTCTLIRDV